MNPPRIRRGNQGERKMKPIYVDLRVWLGDMSPKEFENTDAIYEYFSDENISAMFPNDEINQDELRAALLATLREFEGEDQV